MIVPTDVELEFHEVANIFPMMDGEEFDALVQDIKANGLREPIWLHDMKIIDGRNRYRACEKAGVEPHFREWDGKGSLVAFVVSLNLKRRHLTSSQKAVVALEVEKQLAVEAAQRVGGRPRKDEKPTQIFAEVSGEAREQAAQIMGTNRQYVSDAKKIAEKAPELIEEVRQGKLTIPEAKKLAKLPSNQREKAREKLRTGEATGINDAIKKVWREENRAKVFETEPISGRYACVVIDPPWDWEDEGDVDQFGRLRPSYATMSFDEVAGLEIPAETDAHIYLWITNRSLPKGFELLKEWGFRYVTTLTWCKPSIGVGNYFRNNTEHVLFGVKGKLPLLRADVGTHFFAERGIHSEKPQEFFDLVKSCSPGPHLEMFARQKRDGWFSWGAEIEQEKAG